MSEAVGAELRGKIENPLKFQWASGGAETLQNTVHGFDSSLLIDICNAIIASEEKLGNRYAAVAKQAHLIVGASARLGIKGLVYALAGYNPSTEEVINAFKLYVLEEAKKYEQARSPLSSSRLSRDCCSMAKGSVALTRPHAPNAQPRALQ